MAWPVDLAWQRIYSPYQLLEVGHSDSGLPLLRAASNYFQSISDLRPARTEPDLQDVRDYFDFSYQLQAPVKDVLIVGAGTGNDVSAAIRSGAERIDAVEIDSAIQAIGREVQPEKPYSSPRVHAIINDARSFLRTTDRTYDLIVYGVLDSHTVFKPGIQCAARLICVHLRGLAGRKETSEEKRNYLSIVCLDEHRSRPEDLPDDAIRIRWAAALLRRVKCRPRDLYRVERPKLGDSSGCLGEAGD